MNAGNDNPLSKQSFLEKCTVAVIQLTVLIAFVLTIIGTGTCLWLEILPSQPDTQAVIATSALTAMLFALLLGVVSREAIATRREIKAERQERYANTSARRRMLALAIKELSVRLGRELKEDNYEKATLEAASVQLGHIMDDIASLFSSLTGTECRSTIKAIRSDGTNVWAHTLARDKRAALQNAETDRERNERKYDAVAKNIDFELLYDDGKKDKGYYFNNHLPLSEYHSTSIEYAREKEGVVTRVPGMAYVWIPQEGRRWLLDYKSAIVWPIQQVRSEYVGNRQWFGFLAIDSQVADAFEEKWDAHVGAEIAEQLFVSLWFYQLMDDELNARITKTQSEAMGNG